MVTDDINRLSKVRPNTQDSKRYESWLHPTEIREIKTTRCDSMTVTRGAESVTNHIGVTWDPGAKFSF